MGVVGPRTRVVAEDGIWERIDSMELLRNAVAEIIQTVGHEESLAKNVSGSPTC
jgi:hypothetical protein